jgi:integrin beta 1
LFKELIRTKVSVIFAVTSEVIRQYDELHDIMVEIIFIHQSKDILKNLKFQDEVTDVQPLAGDSSNILDSIRKGYERLISRTQLQDDAPSYIKVEYKTTCGGKFDTPQSTSKCDNIDFRIGDEYDFEVGIKLLDYPEDGTKSVKIKIEEASIDSEGDAMELDVEIDYPCTTCIETTSETSSALCNRRGDWQCGTCDCKKGYVGRQYGKYY